MYLKDKSTEFIAVGKELLRQPGIPSKHTTDNLNAEFLIKRFHNQIETSFASPSTICCLYIQDENIAYDGVLSYDWMPVRRFCVLMITN